MPETESRGRKRRGITAGKLSEREGELGPCELVRGRIVLASPAKPPHARCMVRFGSELDAFVQAHDLGVVAGGEAGIFTEEDPDTVRAADVLFLSKARLAEQKEGDFYRTADLVVEIISHAKSRPQVLRKLPEYFACGVRLVWVADCGRQTVTAYRSLADVRVFTAGDSLPGDDVLPGFSVPVARFFR
jgi:Uma2 family endonuclease